MESRPRLSQEARVRVVVLAEEGYSMNKIAQRLQIGRRTVQEIVKKHKETGSVKDREGRGRKKKTSNREDGCIIKASLKDRRKSSTILCKDINANLDIVISPRTIRRRLLEAGLKSCRAKKKPLLSVKAREKRLAWALEHQSFDWTRVVFSDESRFCLISDRPVNVRRRPGEEYLPEWIVQRTIFITIKTAFVIKIEK